MSIVEKLFTIEEFAQLPDNGRPTELVRGRVVEMNVPKPRHGKVCARAGTLLLNFADQHDLGHVLGNDSGVITHRDPDSLRGADVAFYSFERIPRGPFPSGYLDVVPEVVIEVRSDDDRWPKVLAKVAEYLDAGVSVVCVLDPATTTARTYRANGDVERLDAEQTLRLPEFSPDFEAPVRRFFE